MKVSCVIDVQSFEDGRDYYYFKNNGSPDHILPLLVDIYYDMYVPDNYDNLILRFNNMLYENTDGLLDSINNISYDYKYVINFTRNYVIMLFNGNQKDVEIVKELIENDDFCEFTTLRISDDKYLIEVRCPIKTT